MIEIIPNWHPLFVHFTVTLLILTGIHQLVLWFRPKLDSLHWAIRLQPSLITISALAVLLTVGTGLLAYYSVQHDSPSHLAMTDHRNWALMTAGQFLLGTLIYWFLPGFRRIVAGILFVSAMVLTVVTAFKGGELVYRYGVGVMSLPVVSGDGHDHDHGYAAEHASTEKPGTLPLEAPDGHAHDHSTEKTANESADLENIPESDKGPAESHNHDSHGHPDATATHLNADPSLFSGLETAAGKVVMQFHQALATGNTSLVMDILSDDVLIYEGGNIERSRDEYASHHMASDMAFLQAIDIERLEHQVRQFGDSAISSSLVRLHGRYRDKDVDIKSMETLFLIKESNQSWRIASIHWSN